MYPPLVSARAPASWSNVTPRQCTLTAIPPHMYPPLASSSTPTSWSYATPYWRQMPSLSTSESQVSASMHHTTPPTEFSSPQFMMGPQGFVPSNPVGHLSSTDRFGRFSMPPSPPSHPTPLSSRAYSTPTAPTPGPSLLFNLGLTADFRTPAAQCNVLSQPQFSIPMDLDPDFEASPPIVPSQGFRDKNIS
jgi:hypothetical protein